jgi:DNA polymerase-3 subunit chi
MAVAKFYHLTRSPIEDAVRLILSRAYGEGIRVLVRGRDVPRMIWLDEKLWLVPQDSFLPHGMAGGDHDEVQPILLTHGPGLPPGRSLMTIDGASITPDEARDCERLWILFDGTASDAVDTARAQWTDLTKAGLAAEYWSEESGRWQLRTSRDPA